MHHSELPCAALWMSVATEVVALSGGEPGPAAGIDLDHRLLTATARYLDRLERGEAVPEPRSKDPEDLDVATYLAFLNHRLAHARLNRNQALERQLIEQRKRFTLGDPLWEQMLIRYFEYYGHYLRHRGGAPHYRSWESAQWGAGELGYGTIAWRLPAHARVAIVGDVGTGTDVAAGVLLAALSLEPDAVLHLGDVYYSGTRFEIEHRYAGLFDAVFTEAKRRVPVFGVPGNHEYFSGLVPYLELLDSDVLTPQPGAHQQASYFCLRTADDGWQFLGMDSGFYGHTMAITPKAEADALRLLHAHDPQIPAADTPSTATTTAAGGGEGGGGGGGGSATAEAGASAGAGVTAGTGASAGASVTGGTGASAGTGASGGTGASAGAGASGMVRLREDEARWHLDKLRTFPGRSVLLSHHQLYSAVQVCGAAQSGPEDHNRAWVNTALWRQLGAHFGGDVAAWIWGHEHNLAIYADGYLPPSWDAGDPVYRPLPKGRCAGHGAIPVAEREQPYATTYPVPLAEGAPKLTLDAGGWYRRGFELIELHGAGAPAHVGYYEIAGADPTPALLYRETLT